jgi:hypothetical protein
MKVFSAAEMKQHRWQIDGWTCNTDWMTLTRVSLKYSQKILSNGHTVRLKFLMDWRSIKLGTAQWEAGEYLTGTRDNISKTGPYFNQERISLTFFFKSRVYFTLLHFHTQIITECHFNVQVLATWNQKVSWQRIKFSTYTKFLVEFKLIVSGEANVSAIISTDNPGNKRFLNTEEESRWSMPSPGRFTPAKIPVPIV